MKLNAHCVRKIHIFTEYVVSIPSYRLLVNDTVLARVKQQCMNQPEWWPVSFPHLYRRCLQCAVVTSQQCILIDESALWHHKSALQIGRRRCGKLTGHHSGWFVHCRLARANTVARAQCNQTISLESVLYSIYHRCSYSVSVCTHSKFGYHGLHGPVIGRRLWRRNTTSLHCQTNTEPCMWYNLSETRPIYKCTNEIYLKANNVVVFCTMILNDQWNRPIELITGSIISNT